MKLKTAAKLQWWFAILLIVIKLPLFIVYKAIESLHSKADAILFCIVNYVGNKLLLCSDEYKIALFYWAKGNMKRQFADFLKRFYTDTYEVIGNIRANPDMV